MKHIKKFEEINNGINEAKEDKKTLIKNIKKVIDDNGIVNDDLDIVTASIIQCSSEGVDILVYADNIEINRCEISYEDLPAGTLKKIYNSIKK